MPCTPCRRTSSAILNALSTDVFSFDTVSRRSFGITMSVSTFSLSRWMPCSACTDRRRPSNANGRVTTPMVSAPMPFAISAITGAAPVPVPPPLPAVMKTMSAPFSASSISSRCSSAAWRPTSGSLPAPEAPRELTTDVELHVGVAHQQRLRVGVDRDELDALQPGVDHAVHRVDAAAADADDLDHRQIVLGGAGHLNKPPGLGSRGRGPFAGDPRPPLEVNSYVNLSLCLTLYRAWHTRSRIAASIVTRSIHELSGRRARSPTSGGRQHRCSRCPHVEDADGRRGSELVEHGERGQVLRGQVGRKTESDDAGGREPQLDRAVLGPKRPRPRARAVVRAASSPRRSRLVRAHPRRPRSRAAAPDRAAPGLRAAARGHQRSRAPRRRGGATLRPASARRPRAAARPHRS